MYHIRILDAATRELERLDRTLAARIVERVRWLAKHVDSLPPEPLGGGFAGFYKLRVGDYRVLYQMLHDEGTIVIHAIGHRRETYRKR